MMAVDNEPRSWKEAFAEEIEEISRGHGEPVCTDRLVGLALSGSGVRSAIFGLGIFEALKKFGLLHKVHYLSAVSGGSHICAWLVANCRRRAGGPREWLARDVDWSTSIAHLRRYAQSASAAGRVFRADEWYYTAILGALALILIETITVLLLQQLDTLFRAWRSAGQWRWATTVLPLIAMSVGVANQLFVRDDAGRWFGAGRWRLPMALSIALAATAWIYGLRATVDPVSGGDVGYAFSVPIALLMSLAAFMLLPAGVALFRTLSADRDRLRPGNVRSDGLQAIVALLLMATAYFVAAMMQGDAGASPSVDRGYPTLWRDLPLPVVVLFMSLWLLSFCSLRHRSPRAMAVAQLAPLLMLPVLYSVLWVVRLLPLVPPYLFEFVLGPPILAVGFAACIVFVIGILKAHVSFGTREWWRRMTGRLVVYGIVWSVITMVSEAGFLIEISMLERPGATITVALAACGVVVFGLMATLPSRKHGGMYREGLRAFTVAAAVLFIAGTAFVTSAAVSTIRANSSLSDAALLLVSMVMLAIVAGLFDINEFSLNSSYRKRLVRCYLGATRFGPGVRRVLNLSDFDDDDDLKLSELASPSPGLLPLLNAAVDFRRTHGRSTAPFVLSPLRCVAYGVSARPGVSEECTYVPTAAYAGSLTVGQAMCVSGAGATTDASDHPSRLAAFLMTLFSLRLGWWLPNPARAARKTSSPVFGVAQILRELFIGAGATSTYVRVVDGGRFDNLGIYELVRRGCRVIIAGDGELDPSLTCSGLVRVLRMCKDDLNVHIDLDLSPLFPRVDSVQRLPFAIGSISYPNGTIGTLIYLKALVTGSEETTVRQYHAEHPDFPHEEGGDLFSSEEQFDAYRRLGQHVTRRALSRAIASETSVVDWDMPRLAAKLAGGRYGVPRVFISYRRDDSGGYAGRLHDHLVEKYGQNNVFMDVVSIRAGQEFPDVLNSVLQSCDIALIVIGRQWVNISDDNGRRRLDKADDWVRLEVAASLSRDILVCPLLVGGALMPDASSLPPDLSALVVRQSFALRDPEFLDGLARLIADLERSVGWVS
jgi:hypothetical protein